MAVGALSAVGSPKERVCVEELMVSTCHARVGAAAVAERDRSTGSASRRGAGCDLLSRARMIDVRDIGRAPHSTGSAEELRVRNRLAARLAGMGASDDDRLAAIPLPMTVAALACAAVLAPMLVWLRRSDGDGARTAAGLALPLLALTIAARAAAPLLAFQFAWPLLVARTIAALATGGASGWRALSGLGRGGGWARMAARSKLLPLSGDRARPALGHGRLARIGRASARAARSIGVHEEDRACRRDARVRRIGGRPLRAARPARSHRAALECPTRSLRRCGPLHT